MFGIALLDLTLATGLAAAVLASGVGLTARARASAEAVVEATVAREAVEGLLERTSGIVPAAGRRPVSLDGFPSAARLRGAVATAEIAEAGPGLRRVSVTLRWSGALGPAEVRLETVARAGG